MSEGEIEAFLSEDRSFAPPVHFAAQANAQPSLYDEANAEPEAWWATQARRLMGIR